MFKIIKGASVEQSDQVVPLRQLTSLPSGEAPEGEPTLTPQELLAIAHQQAAEIVARAEQEAAQILQKIRAEAEVTARALQEQARKEGWQEGIAAAREEAEQIRHQASEVLVQAQTLYHETVENMEGDLVDLAVDIAERVVLAQLAVEPRTVMAIARECIELVKNRPLVNIYVNQADYDIVTEGKVELLQGLPGKVELHVLADNGVTPGGCRIETDQGQVDATLETRWEEVLKALYGREE